MIKLINYQVIFSHVSPQNISLFKMLNVITIFEIEVEVQTVMIAIFRL